jgi:hypothetical protein
MQNISGEKINSKDWNTIAARNRMSLFQTCKMLMQSVSVSETQKS